MKDFWFYSWASYASSEAGGQTIFKAGSDVVSVDEGMPPTKVFKSIIKHIIQIHGLPDVHITALNRV